MQHHAALGDVHRLERIAFFFHGVQLVHGGLEKLRDQPLELAGAEIGVQEVEHDHSPVCGGRAVVQTHIIVADQRHLHGGRFAVGAVVQVDELRAVGADVEGQIPRAAVGLGEHVKRDVLQPRELLGIGLERVDLVEEGFDAHRRFQTGLFRPRVKDARIVVAHLTGKLVDHAVLHMLIVLFGRREGIQEKLRDRVPEEHACADQQRREQGERDPAAGFAAFFLRLVRARDRIAVRKRCGLVRFGTVLAVLLLRLLYGLDSGLRGLSGSCLLRHGRAAYRAESRAFAQLRSALSASHISLPHFQSGSFCHSINIISDRPEICNENCRIRTLVKIHVAHTSGF